MSHWIPRPTLTAIALAAGAIVGTSSLPEARAATPILVTPGPGETHETALFRHVLDPDFEGATLQLETRTYLLSVADGTSAVAMLLAQGKVLDTTAQAMAERGYLHLVDRTLRGTNVMLGADGNPLGNAPGIPTSVDPATETVIDGSALLPATELVQPAQGLGHAPVPRLLPFFRASGVTTLESITFKNRSPLAPGGTVLDGTSVRVKRCKFDSDQYGILAVNRGAEGVNNHFTLDISENIILGRRHGLIVGNFITKNAHSKPHISFNHFEGSAANNLVVWNNGSSESIVEAISAGNRFSGASPDGSSSLRGIFVANNRLENASRSGNRINLTSIGDEIASNVTGIGVYGLSNGGEDAEDNAVDVSLVGTRFRGNDVAILALGSDSPGNANRARLDARLVVAEGSGAIDFDHGLGRVEIPGNMTAWGATNSELASPAPSFFMGNRSD